MVSAYEAGRREPSLAMLAKLVEASGHRLVVEAAPGPRPVRGLPDTSMGRRLRRRRREILDIAGRRGATNVRVFGSVARGEDTEVSDVDLLVDLDTNVGLFALAGLQRELEEVLDTEVDVVPADGLKLALRSWATVEAIPL